MCFALFCYFRPQHLLSVGDLPESTRTVHLPRQGAEWGHTHAGAIGNGQPGCDTRPRWKATTNRNTRGEPAGNWDARPFKALHSSLWADTGHCLGVATNIPLCIQHLNKDIFVWIVTWLCIPNLHLYLWLEMTPYNIIRWFLVTSVQCVITVLGYIHLILTIYVSKSQPVCQIL